MKSVLPRNTHHEGEAVQPKVEDTGGGALIERISAEPRHEARQVLGAPLLEGAEPLLPREEALLGRRRRRRRRRRRGNPGAGCGGGDASSPSTSGSAPLWIKSNGRRVRSRQASLASFCPCGAVADSATGSNEEALTGASER